MIRRHLFLTAFLILTACNNSSGLQDEAIKKSTKEYMDAFNQKDAKALGNLWAEDASFVSPESGEVFDGREAIVAKFDALFKKHPNSKIEIKTDSITYPDANEAIVAETAEITENGVTGGQFTYKVYYEKEGNHWLITEIREVQSAKPPNPSPHLKELEWLIGSWVDEDEDTTIASSYQWDRYHVFITQHFSVTVEGKFELEGKQIIGWDPIKEKIHSWIFDSDGGFGEGTWRKEGANWIEEISSTLADGRRASSIYIFTSIDKDRFTIQSTGRSVGGELLPDIAPVTVVKRGNS